MYCLVVVNHVLSVVDIVEEEERGAVVDMEEQQFSFKDFVGR